MTDYEKAVALWKKRNVQNDAELAEALKSKSICSIVVKLIENK